MKKNSNNHEKVRWERRYTEKDTPWDTGRHDFNLENTVKEVPIKKCSALDIGCGSGSNSIWLAKQGFNVTGIDISKEAVKNAKQKAKNENIECEFFTADVLNDNLPLNKFSFVFDRGCFHSFDLEEERIRLIDNIAASITCRGLWLSLIGSADRPKTGTGPPRRKAVEIVKVVEPVFEIIVLKATHFDSNRPNPPRAWLGLFKKREIYGTEN